MSKSKPEVAASSNPSNDHRLLRLPAVLDRVPFSQSTILRMVREGDFPPPVRLGKRAVAWRTREVEAWLASRQHTRPSKSATAEGVLE